jgi:hypothetical protein
MPSASDERSSLPLQFRVAPPLKHFNELLRICGEHGEMTSAGLVSRRAAKKRAAAPRRKKKGMPRTHSEWPWHTIPVVQARSAELPRIPPLPGACLQLNDLAQQTNMHLNGETLQRLSNVYTYFPKPGSGAAG